jgi:type IV pilus assembly protein PilY1
MHRILTRLAAFCAGVAWTSIVCVSAQAEDIEIFFNNNPGSTAQPNILLLLDDSISMDSAVITQANYDPAVVYPGSCSASRVYWSASGAPPDCGTDNFTSLDNFYCEHALEAFAAADGGSYFDRFASYSYGSQQRWEELTSLNHDLPVECEDDWGIHGNGESTTNVYPRDGDTGALWTSTTGPSRITWGASPVDTTYTVFSGNFLNWYYGPTVSTTRIAVMQDVAVNLINSLDGVNVGLMHFNGSDGGIVSHAMADVATARVSMTDAINALTPSNLTPLEESLYEAYLYMTGSTAMFGADGVSAAFSDPANDIYNSPIDQTCQKSHVILLTDGEPQSDLDAAGEIVGLTDFAGQSFNTLVGPSCDVETYPPGTPTGQGGECLDDLAEFMHLGDMSPLAGTQRITTHAIGFVVDLPNLVQTAERGGGEYYTANDTATLTTALSSIVTSILDTQTTFTAPSISINAFNLTRHANEIFVGVFRPSATAHWAGNLKKFRLRASDAAIVDRNDMPIIDPVTGAFVDTVRDFWSPTIDGADVAAGGAASLIPTARNVYTYFGNPELTSSANDIDVSNAALTDGLLGTGLSDTPTRAELIAFINGFDTADVDQDGDFDEPRHQMGDPLHSRPVVVVYGPESDEALVFVGTNDGYLHAFNAGSGAEAWAFLPPEFLDEQAALFVDNSTTQKIYGPDAGIRLQTIGDNDGVIEAADGERALLFFGMRRGGDAYYALDVTHPDAPAVLWRKEPGSGTDAYGEAQLPGLGQTWATVTPTRVDIQGAAQNAFKLALVVPGGYDAGQDAITTSTDTVGNSIYLLDTLTGNLLWHGSRSGATQDFDTSSWGMRYSFPADIRVLDMNGDGLGDRMYAADMGGQVWRFDISNGNPASSLIAGGVIAQLGAAGLSLATVADTRRFYYAPDVARVDNEDYHFIHIGLGSGHRAHPNAAITHDEFYALRDYWTSAPRTQSQYNALAPVERTDLIDVTTDLAASVPQGSAGWRLSLNDGGWIGEKVLAEARTFDGQVFISTYRPGTSGVNCDPALGTTRQYIVDLFNARPVNNLDGSVEDYNGDGIVDPSDLRLTDRYREFEGPPLPETVFFFPGPEGDTDGDGDVDTDDQQFSLSCVAEGNCLGETSCQGLRCFENDEPRFPVRTFWKQLLE